MLVTRKQAKFDYMTKFDKSGIEKWRKERSAPFVTIIKDLKSQCDSATKVHESYVARKTKLQEEDVELETLL